MLTDREPTEHELKCWPEYYDAVERGEKTFEIRKWERPYRVGDTLLLRRYDPSAQDYTGQQMRRKITYILDLSYLPGDNIPHFAGYVALGIDNPRLEESQRRERAAVEDLQAFVEYPCVVCAHLQDQRFCYLNCQNHDRENHRAWQWRGPSGEGEDGNG